MSIEITLNGLKVKVEEGSTLADLIIYFISHEIPLIVERNGAIVHPQAYMRTTLASEDKIQFINPDAGG